MYTVKQGPAIRRGNKPAVPVFQVRDEMGRVFCNEATRKAAEDHIARLEEADKRNDDAEKSRIKKEAAREQH